MSNRPREEAELAAYLRARRSYQKKMSDIGWFYEEYIPIIEAHREGKLKLDFQQTPFELEISNDEADDQQ